MLLETKMELSRSKFNLQVLNDQSVLYDRSH